ncbi:MAG TPA: magnesium transporter CorA family protein [Candidatus Saccharibacteria bacterium]|nr:magnesium transporter CorA family protein [Candidatus Saccharibacteria bacterium]HRQ07181.1 magnesium transporter CorA family protein [Candidatus Saccharibacteria bacterium]
MVGYFTKHSVHEELHRVASPPSSHVWVYGSSVTHEELTDIISQFSLDPNIVRDVIDKHELPRVEYKDDVLYVFVRMVRRTKRGATVSTPLLAIVKGSVYVTLSTTDYFLPGTIVNSSSPVPAGNSKLILLATLVAVVNEYEELINRTMMYIRSIDQRLRNREADNKDFVHFVTVEDSLNEYQTNLTGILAVLGRLKDNKREAFQGRDIEAIDDIMLHVNQLVVSVASHTQSVNSIRNAYSTIANNTLNHRMKTLTVLTVLITLPNVIYGMYGMNVALPFANQPWAYMAIVAFTIVIILVAYLLVRRLKVF